MTVGPSKLAREICPRCWWLEKRQNIKSPADSPWEGFSMVDKLLKSSLPPGTSLDWLGIPGVVESHDRKAVSKSIGNGHETMQVFGYEDTGTIDGDKRYLIDWKTCKPSDDVAEKYAPQFAGYQYAATFPENGKPRPYTAAYVVTMWPASDPLSIGTANRIALGSWALTPYEVEIPSTDYIEKKLWDLLEYGTAENAPKALPNCQPCRYARASYYALRGKDSQSA
jgi:hypothetical protein